MLLEVIFETLLLLCDLGSATEKKTSYKERNIAHCERFSRKHGLGGLDRKEIFEIIKAQQLELTALRTS
ncbi:MAG TPA: hypothetical protein VNJ01_17840 [Bacteriovoracaceae bacterium]|nr:hypothetical protein [Bacteriovoracaceae bacterium]